VCHLQQCIIGCLGDNLSVSEHIHHMLYDVDHHLAVSFVCYSIILYACCWCRALRLGLLTQDMIDMYDPALMFTIPRLAIVRYVWMHVCYYISCIYTCWSVMLLTFCSRYSYTMHNTSMLCLLLFRLGHNFALLHKLHLCWCHFLKFCMFSCSYYNKGLIQQHPFNGPLSGTTCVSQSGFYWSKWSQKVCKSAPCPRQTTMPAPKHSVFYKPDALPAA